LEKEKMYTLVFSESELELIYDQLNIVELYDDTDENIELVSSINNKIYRVVPDEITGHF